MNEIKKTFKGFELFNDITDRILRNRNRAVVLANIAEDHSKNKLITPKAAGLILGYFKEVPNDEKAEVQEEFKKNMNLRGFKLATQ
jgi:hypothetical protein